MKKLIIIVFILQQSFIYSQDHIKPISFDNVVPIWQHVVIDSSKMNDPIFLGTKHLSNWGKNIFLGDSIAYFVYIDVSENLQGGYIEKIDLISGKLIWTNSFNIDNSGKREYPAYVYINNKGNLEILCFRNTLESFILFWTSAQLSVREYDLKTGELIRHLYNNQALKDEENLTFYPEKVYIYPTSNDEYIYYKPITTEDKYLYQLIHFESNTNYIRTDTVLRDMKYYGGFTTQYITKIGKDSLLTGRHNNKYDFENPDIKENFDTFEFYVDLYSSIFDSLATYNLIDNIPYHWYLGVGYDKAGYISVVSKDSTNTNNTCTAISYFTKDGQHYETLDFKKTIPENLLIKKLPNQEGFLLVDRIIDSNINNKRKIEIKKSDGHGNIKLLRTISFEGGRYFNISSMEILKNNTIILGLQLKKPDPQNQHKNITRTQYLIALNGNELGLVSIKDELLKKEDVLIYPNPSQTNITIELPSAFSGHLEIIDVQGRRINNFILINENIKTIDISDLKNGKYFIVLQKGSNNTKFQIKSFIVN